MLLTLRTYRLFNTEALICPVFLTNKSEQNPLMHVAAWLRGPLGPTQSVEKRMVSVLLIGAPLFLRCS